MSDHLDQFLRHYGQRHEHTHGPLGRHVEKVLNQFLECGDPNCGLTLFRCPECRQCMAVPFSCKTRICPSCMSRKGEELAETLEPVLPPVPYRHVVVTFPIRMGIRHRIRHNPGLLRRLTRLAMGVLTRDLRQHIHAHRSRREAIAKARPGAVVAWQTFGDRLNFHPHLHILITDGVFLEDGDFYGHLEWDSDRLTEKLRESVLASFTRLGLLSPESAQEMASWPVARSGFRVHVETIIGAEDRERLQTILRYLTRPPIELKRLHYRESTGEVRYRTHKGAELHWLHPVDFLADVAQHIPPPHRQTVSYHGHFANALGRLEGRNPAVPAPTGANCPRRAAWARLVLRVWRLDPELCPKCGARMTRSRAIMERCELTRLLRSLSLGAHPIRPPPVPVPEGPPITYGAVGRRRQPEQTPRPVADDSDSQIPPDWEDWAGAA